MSDMWKCDECGSDTPCVITIDMDEGVIDDPKYCPFTKSNKCRWVNIDAYTHQPI